MSRSLREIKRAPVQPAVGAFAPDDLGHVPEPVARYFRTAIEPGTPRARSARLTMRGRIKLNRWVDFRGVEVISPCAGFVWAVRTGLISGYDRLRDGTGEMRWTLAGLLPVMRAGGADVTRSAAARAAGEGVWIPTAILPRFGVTWEALDDAHVVSRHTVAGHGVVCHHTLDAEGRPRVTHMDRWGDPDHTGVFAMHAFGVEHTAWGRFAGLTIPTAGRAGWHHGTDRWPAGVFFEYQITALVPL